MMSRPRKVLSRSSPKLLAYLSARSASPLEEISGKQRVSCRNVLPQLPER